MVILQEYVCKEKYELKKQKVNESTGNIRRVLNQINRRKAKT